MNYVPQVQNEVTMETNDAKIHDEEVKEEKHEKEKEEEQAQWSRKN